MGEKKSYTERLDEAIRAYAEKPNEASLCRVLCGVFEGIAKNHSLLCPLTSGPMFLEAKNGKEHLAVLTAPNEKRYPAMTEIGLRKILQVALDREECEGILFNPFEEDAYFLPKELLLFALSAGYRIAAEEYEQQLRKGSEEDRRYRSIHRPIGEEDFAEIASTVLRFEDDPDDFLVLDLIDDPDMRYMQAGRCGDAVHVELVFDPDGCGWDIPLILGHEMAPADAIELLHRLCVDGASPDELEVVQKEFQNIGFKG